MDDPGIAWPAWKFGMKRDDLFTKLHDQYNTIPSSIQDPEAFHHDVNEISHKASTTEEFHRMMAERKDQRLCELNKSLESASFEIIANPSLVGTAQWQYAVQLFRTRSFDSLVRYFVSYLPDDYPWPATTSHKDVDEAAVSDEPRFFEDEPIITCEPLSLTTSVSAQLPLSPRSMTMCSDSSAASPIDIDHHDYLLNNLTPARTLSFSESEPDHLGLKNSYTHHDDDTSQSSDSETPVSSISDLSETHQKEFLALSAEDLEFGSQNDVVSEQLPIETSESETPTPKPEAPASCFFEAKPSPLSSTLRQRSISPSRAFPLVHATHNDCRKSPRMHRRVCSPAGKGRRRTPGEHASRIHKPSPEAVRPGPRGRRWADC